MGDKGHLIYGRRPVLEALGSERQLDKIIIQKQLRGEILDEITQKARKLSIPLQRVPPEKLNRITGGNHQGIIAFFATVAYYRLEDVLPLVYEKGETPLFLLLDGITDVRNTGAIARTAYCAGAHALVIPHKNTAPINAEALKTSAGALSKLTICRETDLEKAIGLLRKNGIRIMAMEGSGNEKVDAISWNVPSAIIIGSEDKGVHPKLQRQADHIIRLPLVNDFDSYNVSVATGMVLYEVMRQRS